MKITPEDEYNSLPDKDLHFSGLKDLDLYDETHLSNEDKFNYIKVRMFKKIVLISIILR